MVRPEPIRAIDSGAEPGGTALKRKITREHVTQHILRDECIVAKPNGYRNSRLKEHH